MSIVEINISMDIESGRTSEDASRRRNQETHGPPTSSRLLAAPVLPTGSLPVDGSGSRTTSKRMGRIPRKYLERGSSANTKPLGSVAARGKSQAG